MNDRRQLFDEKSLQDLRGKTEGLGNPVASFIAHYLNHWSPYKKTWNYEDGCIYKGALDLHRVTGIKAFFEFVYREVSARVAADGTIAGYDPNEFNIDNINAGKVLFPLLAETGEDRFRRAIDRQASQLARHPRTDSGNYWHKKIYPHQVWLDGLYMAQPFQLAYARLTGDAKLAADTAHQFAHVRATMQHQPSGLYVHGWDESRAQKWSDSESGCSRHVWARAMGWFVMAMIDCLELEDALSEHDEAELADLFSETIKSLQLRRTPGGLWFQVIDSGMRRGNYEETSASLMISYAMIKGARLCEIASTYSSVGAMGLRTVVSRSLSPTELSGICAVAGLGGNPYRDGSFDYYVSEPVVANDPKGVGAFFMAVAEACRALH